jgi:hypothetical protein
MGWSNVWPVARWNVPDDEAVFNELAAALRERDELVPAGHVPADFARLAVIKGVPHGSGGPTGLQTVANFQYEIAQTLLAAGPWRWWDRSRTQIYTLADLLTDAAGQDHWTRDLTQGDTRWTPPFPVVFNELRQATNRLTVVRRLAASALSTQTDSVYNLTFGITNWAAQRADTFGLFDGQDDGVSTGLAYDVGLSALVFDSGSDQQWYLDARRLELRFDTSDLAGFTIARAWLEFTTEASPGGTDFSDTFTAKVTNSEGVSRGSFDSDDYSLKSVELPASDINASGDTVLWLRSQRADSADRPAWAPQGPDYSSTYREGFDLADTLRLVVEVEFEYRA